MIQFKHEPLTMGLVAEMEPLLAMQYEELTLHKDVVKLRPRWSLYLLMQSRGTLHVITARQGGVRLVGYSLFLVDQHLHYADIKLASNDVFYVHPDFRRGSVPLRFLRFTRGYLKDIGVHKIAYHFKAGNNFGAILKRLGYSPEEEVVAEII